MLDEDALWRRCELAWAGWLEQDGNAVTHLTDATNNTEHAAAPLIVVGGRKRRAPDLLATKQGSSEYWEVKSRARADVDLLTGQSEHWVELAAFRDYLAVSEEAQMRVWVVLHETPTALEAGRWLRIDVRHLREVGFQGLRRGAGGEMVEAWVWPVSAMDLVQGPGVDVGAAAEPLLPREGQGAEVLEDDLRPVERLLRRRKVVDAITPEQALPPCPDLTEPEQYPGLRHWLDSEPAVGLDVLRRSLGIPHFPRYSVLRVGLDGIDVDDLLGLLEYGVRVFLVSAERPATTLAGDELDAFLDSRMLEWAVVPEAAGCAAWIVDGQPSEQVPREVHRALEAADDSGHLNFAQYRVVHAHADTDVMVMAGAGTGKTETMSERIVYLLATGASASTVAGRVTDLRVDEIALITFTRESAAEMRHRIARTLLLRQRLSRRCALPAIAWMLQLAAADITTIHALSQRITAKSAGVLGLGPDVRVARRTMEVREATYRALSDRLTYLIDRHRRQVPAAYEWQRHVQAVWDALENNGIDLLQLSGGAAGPPDVDWGAAPGNGLGHEVVGVTRDVILEVAREVRAMCLRDQTLPTNQLVPSATSALKAQDEPPVKRYRHVFIDEFQDTDSSQMELALELRTLLGCRLFVVGDPKQGIYRFRGAEGNAFREMERRVEERRLPTMRLFNLTRNFRSGERLLDSLHPFFSRWGRADLLAYEDEDRLRPHGRDKDPSRPVALEKVRSDDFAVEAAARVARWRELHPGESIGILCRQNWQAVKVRDEVRQLKISCELRVGGSFYESPAVRELRVLLEAVADATDSAAVLELCETRWAAGILEGEPPVGVAPADWGESHGPPAQWEARFAAAAKAGSFLSEDLDNLRRRLDCLRQLLSTMPTLAWVVELGRTFQPEGCSIPDEDEAERQRYGRCFDHLVTLMDAQFQDGPTTLEGLLGWLRLQIATNRNEDEPDPETEGKVVALTVHKAKGLEFDRVVIPTTSVQFGPPWSLATRTSILRRPGESPRLLWRWRLNAGRRYGSDFSNVPLHDADWSVDDLDTAREETRLLYVAMTRAREELVVFLDPRTRSGSEPQRWAELLEGGD